MHRHRIAAALAVAIALAVLACLLAARHGFFRLNHLDYLVNDHRYAEAIGGWEALVSGRPDLEARRPDFETATFRDAMQFFQAAPPSGDGPEAAARRREYEALLGLAETRPRLAPLARQMQLRLSFQDGAPTSATLPAARAILAHDGFDQETLWWLAQRAYRPETPYEIPPEVLQFKDEIRRPTPPGQIVSREEYLRGVFLRALLAMNEKDWARAAWLFEVQEGQLGWSADENYPLGMALLNAGRPAAAIPRLRAYLRLHPDATAILGDLLTAELRLHALPEAAATFDALREAGAGNPPQLLRAPYVDSNGSTTPLADLAQRIRGGLRQDLVSFTLWTWLDDAATTGPERAAVDAAAERLIGRSDAVNSPVLAPALLAWALRGGRDGQLDRLIAQWQAAGPNSVVSPDAARGLADLALGVTPPGAPTPRAHFISALRLTRASTRYYYPTLPSTGPPKLLAVRVRATASGGVWPLCNISTGIGFADQTDFYVSHAGPDGEWLIVPFRPSSHYQKMDIAISLLNGAPAEDRTLEILEVAVF